MMRPKGAFGPARSTNLVRQSIWQASSCLLASLMILPSFCCSYDKTTRTPEYVNRQQPPQYQLGLRNSLHNFLTPSYYSICIR